MGYPYLSFCWEPNGAAVRVGAQHSLSYTAWSDSCSGSKMLSPYSPKRESQDWERKKECDYHSLLKRMGGLALKAADILAKDRVGAEIINLHSIKPPVLTSSTCPSNSHVSLFIGPAWPPQKHMHLIPYSSSLPSKTDFQKIMFSNNFNPTTPHSFLKL